MKDKRILLNYGLASGAILIISFFLFSALWRLNPEDMDFELGELIGYASMILALSTVFFGVKSYRDKQRNGFISFKDAFLNGLIIVLIASVIYVVGWMIYYPNFMPDFADQFLQHEQAKLMKEGLAQEVVDSKMAEMKNMMAMYDNPVLMAGLTFLEIFPVGVVVALVSAFILKRKTVAL